MCVLTPFISDIYSLPYRMVYAVATQDTVVLYDTQHSGPIAYLSQLHYASITDLTWYVTIATARSLVHACRAHDGHMLVISSSDGYCSLVMFNANELGTPSSPDKLHLTTPSSRSATPNDSKDTPSGSKECKKPRRIKPILINDVATPPKPTRRITPTPVSNMPLHAPVPVLNVPTSPDVPAVDACSSELLTTGPSQEKKPRRVQLITLT